MNPQQLAALLQLSSPSLPVGAYSYSQGLEAAVARGWIRDEASLQQWLHDQLTLVQGRGEAAYWWRLQRCAAQADHPGFTHWNTLVLASRDSAEMLAEARQMGWSLRRLMPELGIHQLPPDDQGAIAFVAAHAWICAQWQLPAHDALSAYLYAWADNLVLAALKCAPIGQHAGQRLLRSLHQPIADVVAAVPQLSDDQIHTGAPMLALLSAQHESQYSRLFRS